MLITDLEDIQRLAAQRHDEFEVMRYMLEGDDDLSDEKLDAFIDQLAQPIIDAIDCKECGNCCRSLDVYLTPPDAERLAAAVDIPLDAIIDHPRAEKEGEWGVFKQRPCAFLNGKLCSIYEHRPETCRLYPVFTPDFRWTLEDTVQGAALCPIIYNVLDQLSAQVDGISLTYKSSLPHKAAPPVTLPPQTL
jgi:uncharacterized protein